MSNVKVTNLLHGSSASNNITLASDGTTTIPTVKATTQVLVGGVSSTANGGTLQISNGITFPATQSACTDPNTIDDYEEGSWTPTFGNLTVSSPTARYTKVGRFVHCQISFAPSDAGTWSAQNYFTVSSLPFTPGPDGMGTCVFSMGATQQAHFMGSGGSTFYFVCTATAAGVNKNITAPLFLVYSV